jgi:hypothetical protein
MAGAEAPTGCVTTVTEPVELSTLRLLLEADRALGRAGRGCIRRDIARRLNSSWLAFLHSSEQYSEDPRHLDRRSSSVPHCKHFIELAGNSPNHRVLELPVHD